MRIRSETGAGETVVFVHGAGVAGWMWAPQVDALGAWRRVVVDLADHGTDRAAPFIAIEAEADAIGAYIRASSGTAHVVGHSLGAKVVLALLLRCPDVVRSAVVSSALVRPSMLATMMDNPMLNAMSVWMLRAPWLARMQARQFAFPKPEMVDAFVADVGAMSAENLGRPITAFCASLALPVGLDQVRCPVLITVGAKEPGAMQGSAADLQKQLPGAELWTVPGAQHNYPWTHAEAYNARLIAWLQAR